MTVRYPLVLNGTSIEELQSGDTLAGTSAFDAGTTMLFVQTSAPTGWTKSTTHNDKALRVVNGAASSGGSIAFTTAFANGNSGATTLSTSQMPAHGHNVLGQSSAGSSSCVTLGSGNAVYGIAGNLQPGLIQGYYTNNSAGSISALIQSTGGGGSHTHSLSLAVQYVDVIIATKD
jgi:microcystin-dependent protein